MKIAVTGGNGYLGYHVAHYLNADRFSRQNGYDIRERNTAECLTKYDVIVHMAALVDKSDQNPSDVFDVNVNGTLNIIKHLNENHILIFTSTKEIYTPNNAYDYSKQIAENYIRFYGNYQKFRFGVFRLSTIYAPATHGSSWVNMFVDKIANNEQLTLFAYGKQSRDFLYVDDLSRAFETFMRYNQSDTFDIGGGVSQGCTIRELILKIEDVLGKKADIKLLSKIPEGQYHYVTSLSHINKTLGWHPRISIEEGIKLLVKGEKYAAKR